MGLISRVSSRTYRFYNENNSIDSCVMGIHFLEIPNSKHIYVCKLCDTPLAKKRDVQSDNFYGRAGPAYLLRKAYNLKYADPENRDMRTGLHTVRDVYCKICVTYKSRNARQMGWYYEFAFDDTQRYKEGRIILEKRLLKEITGVDEQNPVFKPGNSGRPENQEGEEEDSENDTDSDENTSNSSEDEDEDSNDFSQPRLISASRLVLPWERELSSEDIHQRNLTRF